MWGWLPFVLEPLSTCELIKMESIRPRGISETTWAMSIVNLLVGCSAVNWHGPTSRQP
jgi:hypothetical protein